MIVAIKDILLQENGYKRDTWQTLFLCTEVIYPIFVQLMLAKKKKNITSGLKGYSYNANQEITSMQRSASIK